VLFRWQYLREEFPRQEEIRDAPMFGKCPLPSLRNAQIAANIRELTDFALSAVIITADR